MKKNLRNVLVLALGLMTTVSFAQDWNVDSRTRIDMGGDGDRNLSEQRATLGATWGGSNWGIHTSTVINYDLGVAGASLDVYEAYASTDLFGFANMTMGRQALNLGNGSIIGSNEWSGSRYTRDAMVFAIDNSMIGLDLGIARRSNDDGTDANDGMFINASKADANWSINLLYAANTVNNDDATEVTAMSIDLGYSMMDGALDLAASMNSNSFGGVDGTMNSYGATYNVSDNMSISATQTTQGENAFWMEGGNTGLNDTDEDGNQVGESSWNSHGNMGQMYADDSDLNIGISYDMGNISLAVNMHSVSNSEDADYERKVTELTLGYNLSDNAGLALKYATDDNRDGATGEETYMWLTLTVTP